MLSAIVIVKNEEKLLGNCLESIKWADEIVVFDNGSFDKTVQIAKKFTDKVFIINGQDFASLRNKAVKKALGDWLLFVDADERILAPLKDEILELVKSEKHSAYAISRRNIIFGTEVRYGPFWPDWVVRLLKQSRFEGYVGKIHEYPKFEGSLGYTKNSLLHLTHRNVDHVVLKSLDWSNIDANIRYEAKHPPVNGLRLIRILFTELFNQGIKRKGFFLGTVGVMDALLQTFSMVITYIRLWEMQQAKSRWEVYEEIDRKLLDNQFNS